MLFLIEKQTKHQFQMVVNKKYNKYMFIQQTHVNAWDQTVFLLLTWQLKLCPCIPWQRVALASLFHALTDTALSHPIHRCSWVHVGTSAARRSSLSQIGTSCSSCCMKAGTVLHNGTKCWIGSSAIDKCSKKATIWSFGRRQLRNR